MLLSETEFDIPTAPGHHNLLSHLQSQVSQNLPEGTIPVRLVISGTERDHYHCEVGVLNGAERFSSLSTDSLFNFTKRPLENTKNFNAVFLVPTGVGAEIGGHAGDAAPVARMLASVCDALITHPNVVNASDINEIPDSALYVEGSVICRFLMGTIGLQEVRANRVLVVIDDHQEFFVNAAVNAVSAARASYGLQCPKVIQLAPPVRLMARYTSSGAAAGRVEQIASLCTVLDEMRGEYDAVAISSVIDVPYSYHMDYFLSEGQMVNPWGGVEALFTHALSLLYGMPSAHSPMFESEEIANLDSGIVDPRMAAEAVSVTFLQCILKGLMRSPRILTSSDAMRHPSAITAADVSCLVIPDGCLGLPTLAALEQGIPVIAVRENSNLMKNDLSALPWASGQLHIVENYWEAAGVMAAMRAGIAPESVRRPLAATDVQRYQRQEREQKIGHEKDGEALQYQMLSSELQTGDHIDQNIEVWAKPHSRE